MAKKINKTKLPNITKLPSGAYHCKIYSHTDKTGKRVYKSLTNNDYDELVKEAAQYKLDKKNEKEIVKLEPKSVMTVGQAMDKYIESKSAILSPSTIRGYVGLRKAHLKLIINKQIDKLTNIDIQSAINLDAETVSPKTVRNIHSFLYATLAAYLPDFKMHVTLPMKVKSEIEIPTEQEMKKLFDYVKGTNMEIPISLAACCGMRRSEIAALDWKSINLKNNTISITQALVMNKNNIFVLKSTKSTKSTRIIKIYPFVLKTLKKVEDKAGRVTSLDPDDIYDHYSRILHRLGIKHYRLHDLRHYTASVMLSLGIPKKYIADYLGHNTEDMVDRVYGHIMAEKKSQVEDQMQEYFSKFMSEDENAK